MSIEQLINNEIEQKIDTKLRGVVAELLEAARAMNQTPEVMTLAQLAKYWQVTKMSIHNWTRRKEFPLPIHYTGGNPRYHKIEVDSWSKLEAARELAKERKAA